MIKYIVIFKPNTVNEAWITQRVCLLTACIVLQIALKGFFLLEHEAFFCLTSSNIFYIYTRYEGKKQLNSRESLVMILYVFDRWWNGL